MPAPSKIKTAAKKLVSLLKIKVEKISISQQEEGLVAAITVPEADSGLLIGYHGETLNALQNITNQIVNHKEKVWQRIILDINDYRLRRQEQLKRMAQNASERALATQDEIEMPYLTSFERRIIHLELAERVNIATYSEGEGRNRRLIVAPKKTEKPKEGAESVLS